MNALEKLLSPDGNSNQSPMRLVRQVADALGAEPWIVHLTVMFACYCYKYCWVNKTDKGWKKLGGYDKLSEV